MTEQLGLSQILSKARFMFKQNTSSKLIGRKKPLDVDILVLALKCVGYESTLDVGAINYESKLLLCRDHSNEHSAVLMRKVGRSHFHRFITLLHILD